jgi:hypothetical protein
MTHDPVSIYINGRDLVDILREVELPFATREGHPVIAGSYIGFSAKRLMLPSLHLFGRPRLSWGDSGKTPILGCECGELGCWPMLVRIVVAETTVTWTDFEQGHRNREEDGWSYDGMDPFVFDRQQYISALMPPVERASR